MRSESEMMELILSAAREDDRVRAVVLGGSRADPGAKRDLFQDYDILFLVRSVEPFLRTPRWVDRFGSRVIMQTPEAMSFYSPIGDGRFTYLMQFEDGNRIDLTLFPADEFSRYPGDSLSVALLDKDGLLSSLPPASDRSYHVRCPEPSHFVDCCNEFLWVAPYVAKGLWRDEPTYAKGHLDQVLHPALLQMLSWRAGALTGFSVSTGKMGKHLRRYLPPEEWQLLMETGCSYAAEDIWRALFCSAALFGRAGRETASALGFCYPEEEERRVIAFLRRVQALPPDAPEL